MNFHHHIFQISTPRVHLTSAARNYQMIKSSLSGRVSIDSAFTKFFHMTTAKYSQSLHLDFQSNALLQNLKLGIEVKDQVNFLQKCTKLLTKKGKQSKAQKIVIQTLERIQKQALTTNATLATSEATLATSEATLATNEEDQFNVASDRKEYNIQQKKSKTAITHSDGNFRNQRRNSRDQRGVQLSIEQEQSFVLQNGSLSNNNFKKAETLSAFYIFEQAICNVKPLFELRKIRLSGTPQQFPAVLSKQRQEKIAIRWLVQAAQMKKKKSRSAYGIDYFLALEVLDAFKKQGELRQKRDEIHRTAERNRSLAHRRWWP